MAEIDTSSYLKPTPQPSVLDIAGKLGTMEQQRLAINQQKLDQANQGLTYMTRAMGALGPNATKDQYIGAAQTAVKMGLVPADQLNVFIQRAQAAPSSQSFYNEFMTTAANHQQQIDYHLGRREDIGNNQQVTPSVSSVKPGFGVRPIAAPIQMQPPPTAVVINSKTNLPTTVGAQQPQLPEGAIPAGNLPGQYRMPVQRPTPAIPGPITSPAIQGPSNNFNGTVTGANVEPTQFAQRFDSAFPNRANPEPRGFQAGTPPMFDEGKRQLAEDQANAAQKMTAVKPAVLALKLLPGLRTGPGTEPFNKAIAFMKANNILDTAKENDPTAIYQEANKYLSQYLKGRGGRSDADLAAAEKSSPNVGIQLNPALIKLTKSAIAQDMIEAARPTAFAGRNDLQNYGQHRATFPQSIDQRAFEAAIANPEERGKLTDQMYKKVYKNNPRDKDGNPIGPPKNPPADAIKYFNSLDIAKKAGMLNIGEE